MKAKVDSKRRVVFPPIFRPGDIVEFEMQSDDTVVVRRVAATSRPKLRIVRRKEGIRLAGGPTVTDEDVRRLLNGG